MAALFFILGFVLLICLYAIIANWWEGRAFRKKLQSLQGRFDELDEKALEEGEQALKTLDEMVASINGNVAFKEHLSRRRYVSPRPRFSSNRV